MLDASCYPRPGPDDHRRLYLASVGDQHWRGDSHLLRRGHRYHLLMYTTSGAATGRVDDRAIHATADTVWLFPRHQTYTYTWDPAVAHWHYRWIEFDGAWAGELLRMLALAGRYQFHGCGHLRSLVDRLVERVHHAPEAHRGRNLGDLVSLLGTITEAGGEVDTDSRSGVPDRLVARCQRILLDHLAHPIRLREVAELVGRSPSQVARAFKARTGVTPMAWQRQRRLERAQALLRRGDLSIGEVGVAVGYPVIQHFSRWFIQATGESPRAWRAAAGGSADG